MESFIYERIVLLIRKLNETQSSFAERVGVSQSTIATAIMRKTDPSSKVVAKISQAYPQVNINWLLTGEGEMLNNNAINSNTGTIKGDGNTIGQNNHVNNISQKGDGNQATIGEDHDTGKMKAKIKEMEKEIDSLKKDKAILQEFITLLQNKK